MRAVHKRYTRELMLAMLAYAVALVISIGLLRGEDQPALRFALAALPLLPVAHIIRAMVRVIRDQDELERRVDLESIAIAAAIAAFGFFSYGLLATAKVLPNLPGSMVAIWVLPVLFGGFGLVKCLVVARRYQRE